MFADYYICYSRLLHCLPVCVPMCLYLMVLARLFQGPLVAICHERAFLNVFAG